MLTLALLVRASQSNGQSVEVNPHAHAAMSSDKSSAYKSDHPFKTLDSSNFRLYRTDVLNRAAARTAVF